MKTTTAIPIHYWPLWCLLQLIRFVICLLPYRLLLILGKYVGRLYYCFNTRAKRVANINIDLCFPDWTAAQRHQLLVKYFESLGMALFETPVAWWASQNKLTKLAHIHGLEHLERLRAQHKNILILGGHFLSMEMAGRLMSSHLDFSIMFRNPKHPLLSAVLKLARKPHYNQLHERKNMRTLVKQLNQGIPLWYSPDIDPSKRRGVFAPFFGVTAHSLKTTARLAQITNASVLMTSYFRRDDHKGYDITFYPPLEHFPTGDAVNDATRINMEVEKLVRHKPEQYLWQYRRFRTRPRGEPPLY